MVRSRLAVLALGLLPLLLVSVACGGGDSRNAATSRDTVTETLSPKEAELARYEARPSATPTVAPLIAEPHVRICTSGDISTGFWPASAESQHLTIGIAIVNRSETECQIRHRPALELIDVSTNVLPLTISGPTWGDFQRPALLLPGRQRLDDLPALRAGQVLLVLTWRPHDGSGLCPTPPPRATQVRLILPDDGGEVLVDVASNPVQGIAPCDGTVVIRSYSAGSAE